MREGWQKKKLHQVCELINGRAYSKPELLGSGKYPVLRVGNFFTNNHWYYSDLELEGSKYCDTGDLLYAWSASFGPRIWDGGKVIFHYHIWKLVHDQAQIDKRYLFYFLQWDTEKTKEEQGTGTTMLHVSMGSMKERDIPVPPLPEQQRIVTLLDDAFAGLDTAKANAERNLQNARAIFESHLEAVFSRRGEGWAEKKLEEIGRTQTGSTPKTTDHSNYGDYISFVKPGDFKADGTLDYGKDGLSKAGADGARIVPAGSVLMVCIGATIGKCGYSDRAVTTNQQVNALTPSDGSSNRFIYYQMLTESFQRSIIQASGQATLPIINKSKWSSLLLWLPPTAPEQEAIAEEFDALLAETQRLTHLYERKLAALEELKKSLLQQAFNGEL